MKIVVLDAYALNPGDMDWGALEALGDVRFYDRTAADEVLARIGDAELVLTNKVAIDGAVIEQAPNLKYIGVMATGYNIIDIETAKKKGVVVSNVPGYSTASVVQLTFSLMMELCYRVQRHSDAVMEGKWAESPDFTFWDYPLIELAGKKLGIIGFGAIGQQVADVATALGMEVVAHSRTQTDQSARKNFRWAEREEVIRKADVLTLHCPLTPDTENLMNKETISLMKPSSFLINTSRGGLIDGQALADALNADQIAGAGVDVLAQEPPQADHPLFSAKNILITPHIAWATAEARERLMAIIVQNVDGFINGQPQNEV